MVWSMESSAVDPPAALLLPSDAHAEEMSMDLEWDIIDYLLDDQNPPDLAFPVECLLPDTPTDDREDSPLNSTGSDQTDYLEDDHHHNHQQQQQVNNRLSETTSASYDAEEEDGRIVAFDLESILDITPTTTTPENYHQPQTPSRTIETSAGEEEEIMSSPQNSQMSDDEMSPEEVAVFYDLEDLPKPQKNTQDFIDAFCYDSDYPFAPDDGEPRMGSNEETFGDLDAVILRVDSSSSNNIKLELDDEPVQDWLLPAPKRPLGLNIHLKAEGEASRLVSTPTVVDDVIDMQNFYPIPTPTHSGSNTTDKSFTMTTDDDYDNSATIITTSSFAATPIPSPSPSPSSSSNARYSFAPSPASSSCTTPSSREPRRGRGRPRKEVRTAFDESMYEGLSPGDKKYKMLRDRNNEASRKSRMNRTAKVKRAGKEVRGLTRENQKLQKKLSHYESLAERLKGAIKTMFLA